MPNNSKLDAFKNRSVPAEIDRFTQRNLAIVDRIADTLVARGWSQNELARRLSKRPSQVSKWMTGLQNMTLLTISELEAVLNIELITVLQSGTGAQEHTRRTAQHRIVKMSGTVQLARKPLTHSQTNTSTALSKAA